MPLPVFVGATTQTYNVGVETPTVAVPAGAQNGDRLIALLSYAGTVSCTSPAGWTEHTNALGNTNGRFVVISRIMSTGVTQAQFALLTGQASYAKATLTMVAYRGDDALNYGTTVLRSSSSSSTVAPSVTTGENNALVVGLFGDRATSQTSATAPTGMTERGKVVQGGGGGTSVLICDEARATAGATGTRTATYGVATDNAFGVLLELSPAATAGPTISVGADATSTVSTAFSRTMSTTGTVTGRTWTQQSGPASPTISGSTTATMSVTPTVPGTYVFRGTATDGTTPSFDEFTLWVNSTTSRPDTTLTNPGNWVAVGAATMWEAEADESDATYAETPDAAVGAAKTSRLSPLLPGPVTVATKARVTSGSATLRQELLQGTTVIATWDDALTTSFATYTHTTVTAETSSITNFNDLYLRRTWLS